MEGTTRQQRLVLTGFVVITMAGLAAFLGTYWDDAWHTDFGRDDFFIPPHMVLYTGITLMGAVATLGALAEWLRTRSVRAVWGNPALRLGLLGVAATLAAAPVDELWHVAFGRDAVVWSPPHMLGFAALFALATGFFLEAARLPGRWGVMLTVAMGAFLIGAVHVPVMEYESDVPQFAVLWYLPVLTAGTALAFGIIETRRRLVWTITAAAAAWTGIRIGIMGFLMALDHSLIFVPPIVLPALAFELTGRLRWSAPARAATHAAVMFAVYAPFLNLALGGIRLAVADAVIGVPLAAGAAWLALAGFSGGIPRPRPAHVVAVLVGLALIPGEARAHDPGQGTVVGTARLEASPVREEVGLHVEVLADTDRPCDRFEPVRLVARRAGITLSGPLVRTGECGFVGSLQLPGRGRWFVYAELTWAGRPVEAWLPVMAGDVAPTFRDADIYIPPARAGSFSPVQVVGGILLYALCVGFLWIAVGAARRPEDGDGGTAASSARPANHLPGRKAVTMSTLVLALASAAAGSGQEAAPGDSSAILPTRAERRHVLIPRPLVFHDTETGWSAGMDVFHSYRPRGSDRPPSMNHLYGVYTSTGMAMAMLSTAVHTEGDLYRLGGHASYMHFPQVFYGIGRDLPMDAGEPYTSRSATLDLSVRRRFGPRLVLGAGWSGERYTLLERDPSGRLADGSISGSDGGVVSSVSIQAGLDTREGLPSTRRGSYLVVTGRGADPVLGSDFRFARLRLDARHFTPLPAGQVLGLHAVTTFTFGDAPFQSLPRMGGDDIMRGYSPAFHRDRHLVAAQAEYRVPLWWRFGAVGFTGAGAVAPDLAAFDRDAVRLSYGGGLRFAINRAQRLNFRADFGMGSDGSRLHVSVGEAF
jgi:hypothetical protein